MTALLGWQHLQPYAQILSTVIADMDPCAIIQERYYREKLHMSHLDPAAKHSLVNAYITGLEWVLQYYYRGVASWGWFYPYHFAPLASDCLNIATMDSHFMPGSPFSPFLQQLAVLPASSSKLLPSAFWVRACL